MKLRNKLILIKYLSKVEQKAKLDRGENDSWKCNSVDSFTFWYLVVLVLYLFMNLFDIDRGERIELKQIEGNIDQYHIFF